MKLWSCILKASAVEWQSIFLIDTLDQHSVNTQLTLHHHLGWQLVDSWPILDRCIWLRQHSAKYKLTVHVYQVLTKESIKMAIEYWSQCQLRVSIDTWTGMPKGRTHDPEILPLLNLRHPSFHLMNSILTDDTGKRCTLYVQ